MARILIVDDSKLITTMLKDLLEGAGYEVVTAGDSMSALAALRKEEPDLIFMDILMPGMDGHQVTKLIKLDKKFKNTPVIIFSSLTGQVQDDLAKNVGALIHLQKETPPDEILKVVEQALRSIAVEKVEEA